MKRWLRILLIVIVALPVVLAAAAVKIFGLHTFVGPRKRDLTSRTFERTSARLERFRTAAKGTPEAFLVGLVDKAYLQEGPPSRQDR